MNSCNDLKTKLTADDIDQIMKIKMVELNGAYYAKNQKACFYLMSTGLKYTGGFLSLSLLENHVEKYGFKVELQS